MAGRTISLDLVARNRASQVFNQVSRDATFAANRAQSAFVTSNDRIGASFAALSRNGGQAMSQLGGSMTRYVTLPLAAIGVVAVKSAISFESAFAGVRKTVTASETEFSALRDGILDMAQKLPASREAIAGVAAAAGQLGIETPQILSFTRTMIDLGESTNLSANDAASALARLANITQLPQAQFSNLGSSVVALGNNFATTESEIVDMGLRIASAGTQIGLTEAQILGVSSALSSVGIDAEAGGTAISRVMIAVAKAVDEGGTKLDRFASTAGLSARGFADAFRQDAAGTLVDFVEGLDRTSKSGQSMFAVLEDLSLGDVRVGNSLRSLAGAGGLLRESIDLSTAAFSQNVALSKEAGERYKTTESQLRIAGNQASEVARKFGESLAPALIDAVQAAKPLLGVAQEMVSVFAGLPRPLQTAALGLGGLAAAAGPALFLAGGMVRAYGTLKDTFAAASARTAAQATATESLAAANTSAAATATSAAVAQARVSVASVAQAGAIAKAATAQDALRAALAEGAVAGTGNAAAQKKIVDAARAADRSEAGLTATTRSLNSAIAATDTTAASAARSMSALKFAGIAAAIGFGAAVVGLSRAHAAEERLQQQTKELVDDLVRGGDVAATAARKIADAYGPAVSRLAQTYVDQALAGDAAALSADDLAKKLYLVGGGGLVAAQGSRRLTKELRDLVEAQGAAAGKSAALNAAETKYRDDLTLSTQKTDEGRAALARLGADRAAVVAISGQVAVVEKQVAAAHDQGAGSARNAGAAVAQSGAAAAGASFGYLSLAGAATTAAQALANINSGAFASFDAGLSVEKSQLGLDQALSDLNNPKTSSGGGGGGGGGGSTQTATAAAIEKTSKELAVRDASRQVESATRGVKDAEKNLTQARKESKTAATEVSTAQKNLRTVLHGVAADSLAAKTATEAFASAQNAAASSALDLAGAQRNLAIAKNEQKLNPFGVIDAQRALDQARATAQENQEFGDGDPGQRAQDLENITKAEVALQTERIKATAKNEEVKRAEIALKEARINGKQKTRDLDDAQRTLNGTLRGYGPTTREAKDAQNQLTEAQKNAREKTDAVATATLALRDANDQTATSALGLQRAIGDMDGSLSSTASGGGGVGKMSGALDDFKSRLITAKEAARQFSIDVGNYMLHSGKGLAASLIAQIEQLKTIVGANPLLKGAFDSVLANLQSQLRETTFIDPISGKTFDASTGKPVPGRAAGGPVRANEPYLVGEKGPELFVPRGSGDVVPQSALKNSRPFGVGGGGGETHLHVHIEGPVYADDIEAVVVKAMRNATRKNGSISGVSVTR